jgi:hypothetical protein
VGEGTGQDHPPGKCFANRAAFLIFIKSRRARSNSPLSPNVANAELHSRMDGNNNPATLLEPLWEPDCFAMDRSRTMACCSESSATDNCSSILSAFFILLIASAGEEYSFCFFLMRLLPGNSEDEAALRWGGDACTMNKRDSCSRLSAILIPPIFHPPVEKPSTAHSQTAVEIKENISRKEPMLIVGRLLFDGRKEIMLSLGMMFDSVYRSAEYHRCHHRRKTIIQ